jgi:hypothetical protein
LTLECREFLQLSSDFPLNICLAGMANKPEYKVHRYEKYFTGAGEIKVAVENVIRTINRANGVESSETNVCEVSGYIDE